MEILALHFLDLEGNTHTTTPPMTHTSRKVDRSDSTSPVPGVNSDAADAFAFIYGVVGPTIVTFGLIGNILILFVVGRSRMEGAIPVYLSALALSDMGALLSSIPLWIRLAQKVACSHWNAFYYGHLELFILNTFMAASIFNVVALTVERYTSVCLAGQFPKIHTPLRAKMAVATSFLLGLIVSFPLCILKYVVANSEEEMMARNSSECRFQYLENRNVTAHPLWTAYVWIGESLVRFLPGLILVILNMLILIKYHGVVKTRRQMQRGQPNANANGNNGRSDRNQHPVGGPVNHLRSRAGGLSQLPGVPRRGQPAGNEQLCTEFLHVLSLQQGVPQNVVQSHAAMWVLEIFHLVFDYQ